jgi:hypothetical protein
MERRMSEWCKDVLSPTCHLTVAQKIELPLVLRRRLLKAGNYTIAINIRVCWWLLKRDG